MLSETLATAERLSDAALADCDRTAASRANRALQRAAQVEDRLAASADPLEDGSHAATLAEMRAVEAGLLRKIVDLVASAGPLHCAKCGRELRMLPIKIPEAPAAASPVPRADRVTPRTAKAFERASQLAERAVGVGDYRSGARSLVDMVEATATTARAELRARKHRDPELVVMSKAEVDRELQRLDERLERLTADQERLGGLCCGECSRRIRLFLASDGRCGEPPVNRCK